MIEPGDYLKQFEAPSTLTETLKADDCIGRPLVLIFYLKDGHDDDAALLRGFANAYEQFTQESINLVGVGIEPISAHKPFADALGLKFSLLSDQTLQIATRFGIAEAQPQADGSASIQVSRTVVFYDASMRVVRVWRRAEGDALAGEVLAFARHWLHREEPRDIVSHAPVLLIPNVLPPELCRRLMELWETENEDSGFMKQVGDKTVGMTDYSHKIRRDHYMTAGAENDAVKQYVSTRVIPEIFKSYNYNVTRREDFRIACYDASRGGYFRPHRDNTTDGTAHRRFAMSLLLNDDYDGGYLRFPEFGQHRYRPPAGAACVFSCSLLHEATDVTAGRRLVLLSFFYGEAEAKRREEYAKRTGAGYRA